MKKLLVILLMTLCASAMAQRHHGGGYWGRGYGGGWQWMVPTVIGGAIVYEVARQQPVYVQQPVIIQQQQPVIVQPQNQSCSPWTETQNPDGTITRTRTCTQLVLTLKVSFYTMVGVSHKSQVFFAMVGQCFSPSGDSAMY